MSTVLGTFYLVYKLNSTQLNEQLRMQVTNTSMSASI